MRVWHNFYPVGDIVEYVPGKMYGVIEYRGEKVLENRRWLATMMTYEDVEAYIDWCDLYCDKIIYNAWTKKDDQDEWL